MANYVVIVDLEENGSPDRYLALKQLMCDFGFTPRGPETLRPAQFSITSALPLGGLKHMVQDRIKAELQPHVIVDAYEIREILQ
jgi:hypothetical protein